MILKEDKKFRKMFIVTEYAALSKATNTLPQSWLQDDKWQKRTKSQIRPSNYEVTTYSSKIKKVRDVCGIRRRVRHDSIQ